MYDYNMVPNIHQALVIEYYMRISKNYLRIYVWASKQRSNYKLKCKAVCDYLNDPVTITHWTKAK